jgi:nuclear pore complex protein Nup50
MSSSTAAPSLTAKPSDEKPSLFAGFKGFSAFTSSSTSTASSTVAPTLTTTKSATTSALPPEKPSILIDTSNKTATTPSFFGQSTTATTQSTETQMNGQNDLIKSNDNITQTNTNGKSITEQELKFITGLNDLYEKCYGSNKRVYKLPDEASSNLINENVVNNDPESKYTYMLGELNKHCAKWISKHIEESPYVILTPVFVDYFNYLISLERRFFPQTFQQQQQQSQLTNGHKMTTSQEVKPTKPPSQTTITTSSTTNFTSLMNNTNNSNLPTFKFGSNTPTDPVKSATTDTAKTAPAPTLSFFANTNKDSATVKSSPVKEQQKPEEKYFK